MSGANCPGDEPIALEPQLIDLLVYLVCSPASRILSRDIWDLLARVFDAWGFERCLWGTDWTRAFAVVNYEQAVEPFLKTDRLSKSERAMLMGGACAKAYGWKPKLI